MKKVENLKGFDDPRLSELLSQGAVGVMPTDTQYGLITSVSYPGSINRLYSLKGRENRPGTLLAASPEQLLRLGLDAEDIKTAERFWPGAVSVVIPAPNTLHYLHLGMGSLAVRIPDNEPLRRLLSQTGILQTSSANPTGEQPAETMHQAKQFFDDKVDFYVDARGSVLGQPSTVIAIKHGKVSVLRQGAVQISD